MTRIVMVSDTHGELSQVRIPDGDVLLHCGDWSYLGQQPELIKFGRDLRKLSHKHKLIVPGNHDLTLDPFHEKYHKDHLKWLKLDKQSHLLINSVINIEGLNIFGTPMIPKIGSWAFGYSHMHKEHIYNKVLSEFDGINQKIDIVISHGPPLGIMDEEHYGCPILLDFIQKLKPRIHVFGHCHEGYGQQQIGDTLFINAAQMSRHYKLAHPPVVIDI